MPDNKDNLKELVAEVAAAYFSNVHVNPADIGAVIAQIATSLNAVGEPAAAPAPEAEPEHSEKLTSQQIRKSITPNGLVSFEDGRSYKTLKRHLSIRGLSPQQYREKWGLPSDYPMVAASYSAARSQLAKNLGLGQMRTASAVKGATRAAKPVAKNAVAGEGGAAPDSARRKPGRPRKAAT